MFHQRRSAINKKLIKFIFENQHWIKEFEINRKKEDHKKELEIESQQKSDKKFFYPNAFDAKVSFRYDLDFTQITCLIYMAKRIEVEREGGIYLFSTFVTELMKIRPYNKVREICKKFKIRKGTWDFFTLVEHLHDLRLAQKNLSIISNAYYYKKNTYTNGKSHETGVFTRAETDVKFNFRRSFSTDIQVLRKYFLALCVFLSFILLYFLANIFQVNPTDEIIFYLDKYVYTILLDKAFIPEYHFSLYIGIYYSNRGELVGSNLERRLMKYLEMNRRSLYKIMQPISEKMNRII